MCIQSETINFIFFVGIGWVFACVFDFFRALRKVKKPSRFIITIQDIIYFFIIGVILVIAILNIRDEVFRMYLIFAIVLGIITYALIVVNKVRNLFVLLINASGRILEFVFLPIKIQIVFWDKVCKKIKKCVKLCCKKKTYMIEFYHKKVNKDKFLGLGIKKQKKEES